MIDFRRLGNVDGAFASTIHDLMGPVPTHLENTRKLLGEPGAQMRKQGRDIVKFPLSQSGGHS